MGVNWISTSADGRDNRQVAIDRGSYGESSDGDRKGGALPIVIMAGVAAGIYALSPGARYYYKHRRLPPAEETGQWPRGR